MPKSDYHHQLKKYTFIINSKIKRRNKISIEKTNKLMKRTIYSKLFLLTLLN